MDSFVNPRAVAVQGAFLLIGFALNLVPRAHGYLVVNKFNHNITILETNIPKWIDILNQNERLNVSATQSTMDFMGTPVERWPNVTSAEPDEEKTNVEEQLGATQCPVSIATETEYQTGALVNLCGKIVAIETGTDKHEHEWTQISVMDPCGTTTKIKQFNTDTRAAGLKPETILKKNVLVLGVQIGEYKGGWTAQVGDHSAFFRIATARAMRWVQLARSFPSRVWHTKFRNTPADVVNLPNPSLRTLKMEAKRLQTPTRTVLDLILRVVDPLSSVLGRNKGRKGCRFFGEPGTKHTPNDDHTWDHQGKEWTEIANAGTWSADDLFGGTTKMKVATALVPKFCEHLGLPQCENGVDTLFDPKVYPDPNVLAQALCSGVAGEFEVVAPLYQDDPSMYLEIAGVKRLMSIEEFNSLRWKRAGDKRAVADGENPPAKRMRLD